MYCMGYIAGIADTIMSLHGSNYYGYSICLPQEVTLGQLTDLTRSFLSSHPGQRHFTANSLVAAALDESFPCRKKENPRPPAANPFAQ